MKPCIRVALSSFALILVALVSGCGKMATHKIADGIKAALPNVVGPADSWDVSVTGNEGTMLGGRIPGVSIHGINVQVTPQITMAEMNVDARDIYIDIRHRSVKSIGALNFDGKIDQAALDRYLRLNAAANPTGVKDPHIKLRHDDLVVNFKHVEYGIGIPISVAGRAYVDRSADSKIDFHATAASIARVGIPQAIYSYEMDRLNPIVDLATTKLPLHVKDIKVVDQQIVFSGSTEVTAEMIAEAKRQADSAK